MARIVFEIKDSLRDLFKAAVASEGLQMSEVLREFINSYSLYPLESDASPAEIADLVKAAQSLVNALPDCVIEWSRDQGGLDSTNSSVITYWRDEVKDALAPFETGAEGANGD